MQAQDGRSGRPEAERQQSSVWRDGGAASPAQSHQVDRWNAALHQGAFRKEHPSARFKLFPRNWCRVGGPCVGAGQRAAS
jgi:hypothetical protein